MSILEEFEFDSLPYVDKEFEDPHMQAAVREAIAAEMRRFKPRRGGYISHLPYPSLKRTPSIKSSMQSSPNGDGNIYLYMAFADHPIVGSNGTIALAI